MMSREITRRDFLKAGAVGLAATSVLGSVNVFADEKNFCGQEKICWYRKLP